jgi:hypothetical protein
MSSNNPVSGESTVVIPALGAESAYDEPAVYSVPFGGNRDSEIDGLTSVRHSDGPDQAYDLAVSPR